MKKASSIIGQRCAAFSEISSQSQVIAAIQLPVAF
jgi:hypothetical protein